VDSFDRTILVYLHELLENSPLLTKFMLFLYSDDLKFGVFVALIWWAWFEAKDKPHVREVREKIIAGFIGAMCCLGVVRVMVAYLPMRLRPLANPSLGLNFPVPAEGYAQWSSFPSDHAALFTFLTVTLFSISVPLGILGLLDTVFLICFPRIFLGIHYPTDIVAGAIMGVAGGIVFAGAGLRSYLSRPILAWIEMHPASFYASAFILSFVLAHVFFPVINIALRARHFAVLITHTLHAVR
jgi:membrane-associated phospholipid phosphatase